MATEKFFVFNEDGALKRLKGRIVRFLDNEDPTGSDKSAIRTSLEVSPDAAGLVQADIGTQPNEIPVNGMLGDMAFQSSDGVSVVSAEVETLEVTDKVIGNLGIGGSNTYPLTVSKTGDGTKVDITNTVNANFRIGTSGSAAQIGPSTSSNLELQTGGTTRATIDASGRVGIGTASPSNAYSEGDDLVIGDATDTFEGISLLTSTSGKGAIYFGDGTGASAYRGFVRYLHSSDSLELGTVATARWALNNSGHLVAQQAGNGIDFGSGASTTIDDYEEGTWTPVYGPSSGSFATMTMAVQSAKYVKVGSLVHLECYIRTDNVDTTGGSGTLKITGLPFTAAGYAGVSIDYAKQWVNSPISGFVVGSALQLQYRSTTTGSTENSPVSDLTTGSSAAKNQLIFSVTYKA